jgi:hypothetical protein
MVSATCCCSSSSWGCCLTTICWRLEESWQDKEGAQDPHPVLADEAWLFFLLFLFRSCDFLLSAFSIELDVLLLGVGFEKVACQRCINNGFSLEGIEDRSCHQTSLLGTRFFRRKIIVVDHLLKQCSLLVSHILYLHHS